MKEHIKNSSAENDHPVETFYWSKADRRIQHVIERIEERRPILKEKMEKLRPVDWKGKERVSDEQEEAKSGLEKLLRELTDFNKRVEEILVAGQSTQPGKLEQKSQRSQKKSGAVKTPIQRVNLKRQMEKKIYAPEIRKGRIYFSCPSCFYPTMLLAEHAGQRMRCPRCFSALRVPDPTRNLPALNLENHLEALLHPEQFPTVIPSRYRLVNCLPRLPEWKDMAGAGISLVMTILLLSAFSTFHQAPPSLSQTEVANRSAWAAIYGDADLNVKEIGKSLSNHRARARLAVQGFLQSTNAENRSLWVNHGAELRPFLEKYYLENPIRNEQVTETSSLGFYFSGDGLSNVPVTTVTTLDALGIQRKYQVEHHLDNERIAWEESLGFNRTSLDQMVRSADNSSYAVRVEANLDDYYNYQFGDSHEHLCLKIRDPLNEEQSYFGYLSHQSPDARRLIQELAAADHFSPQRIVLEIQALSDSKDTRQVVITKFLSSNWHVPKAGTALADNTSNLHDSNG